MFVYICLLIDLCFIYFNILFLEEINDCYGCSHEIVCQGKFKVTIWDSRICFYTSDLGRHCLTKRLLNISANDLLWLALKGLT